MTDVDLKKVYRVHYTAKKTPAIVHVPARPFLMIDGRGDPNTAIDYADAVQALYPIAYGFRAVVKAATGDSYTVMPLEGLWWVPDMADFDPANKSNWWWTVMICLPDNITTEMASEVIPTVTEKKALVAGPKVRVEWFAEGCAAQILHIGPYADEAPTMQTLHRFIEDEGRHRTGKHHEIYLSDPRKADPATMRTILRQPCTPA